MINILQNLKLNEWGDTKLIEKFRPRLEMLVNKTEDVGWG